MERRLKRANAEQFGILPTIRHVVSHAHERDYDVYVRYQVNAGGSFVGTLKVTRRADGRLLFPFVGSPTLGPFSNKTDALDAAAAYGEQVIAADIARPE